MRKVNAWIPTFSFVLALSWRVNADPIVESSEKSSASRGGFRHWRIGSFPNPQDDVGICGSDRICDPDGVLSDKQIKEVEDRIKQLESDTPGSNPTLCQDSDSSHSIQMAIGIAKKIDITQFREHVQAEDRAQEGVKKFATELHNKWGVGKKTECGGTGIFLFVSVADRALFISKGAALESILTDRRLDKLIERLKPWLRDENYKEALIRSISLLEEYVANGEPSANERRMDYINDAFPILVLGVFVLTIIYSGYRQRQLQREYALVESQLSQIDRDRAEALQGRYNCTSCPICLNDFEKPDDEHSPPKIGSDGLPLKLLRCGHVFDETCWSEWVSSGTGNIRRCPICQQDVGTEFRESPTPSSQEGEQQQIGEEYALRRQNDDLMDQQRQERALRQFQRERNFRLARLAMQYPSYIQPQLQRWTSSTYDGPLARDPSFVRQNPQHAANQPHASNSGGYRSSGMSSFGGGSSGGGRGGSW